MKRKRSVLSVNLDKMKNRKQILEVVKYEKFVKDYNNVFQIMKCKKGIGYDKSFLK